MYSMKVYKIMFRDFFFIFTFKGIRASRAWQCEWTKQTKEYRAGFNDMQRKWIQIRWILERDV